MSKPTFDEKYIAAALDLAAKATPRPWHAESLASGVRHLERNCSDWYFDDVPDGFHLPGRNGGDGGSVDGNYIALAANDFPAALEEIRALRDEIARHDPPGRNYTNGQVAEMRQKYEAQLAAERERADRAEASLDLERKMRALLHDDVERLRAALAEIVADASCSAYIAQIAEGALASPAPTTEKP